MDELATQISDSLLQIVTGGGTAQRAVDLVYEVTALPVIAFDPSFHLIAFAFPRPLPFAPWEALTATGQLSEDYINASNALCYQQMMYSVGTSRLFDWGNAKEYPQVCGPIMKGSELAGYCGISAAGWPDLPSLLAINDLLCHALAAILRSPQGHTAAQLLPDDRIEKILLDPTVTCEDAAFLRQEYPGPYLYAILSAEEELLSVFQYLKDKLSNGRAAALGAIRMSHSLCLLFYHVQDISLTAQVEERLRDLSRRYGLSSMSSDLFFDPAEIPEHRLQAEMAGFAGRARPEHDLDHMPYSFRREYERIVCQHALEDAGGALRMLPAMQILADESGRENIDYFETLEAYFRSFGNTAHMADELKIHKNTAHYRLKKLQALTGLSLSDEQDRLSLKIGLLIYHYLHRTGGDL